MGNLNRNGREDLPVFFWDLVGWLFCNNFCPPQAARPGASCARGKALHHEKTLQFYIQTLIKQNKKEKASEELARLREANPKNPSLAELTELVNDAQVR